VSHPTPLHPDADLALVLDEMRQSVAAWGDEGMVMRLFRAGICLALLSILDTLIDLLADFRAGRLPPVLPAYDEPAYDEPAYDEIKDETTAEARPAPAHPPAVSKPDAASRPIRTRSADDPRAEPADVPDRSAAPRPGLPARHAAASLSPPRLAIRHPAPAPRADAFHPSHVPRRPAAAFGFASDQLTHAIFVTFTERFD
jgi:hypothetical protein